MNKTLISFLTIFAIFFISSCSSTPVKTTPAKLNPLLKPFWVDNPQKHPEVQGKIFGLGSAREHIKGIRHQRLLAISSAINEVAQQQGVKVNTSIERVQSVSQNSANSSSQMYSKQTVDGKIINAKIVEIWKDQNKNELFVLMVSE